MRCFGEWSPRGPALRRMAGWCRDTHSRRHRRRPARRGLAEHGPDGRDAHGRARAARPCRDRAGAVAPGFAPRITPLVRRSNGRPPLTIDRIAHRYWDYPRWLRREARADVYHIVDHSYAHLASDLPAGRVVVTCHDTDAFRTLFLPDQRESSLPRMFVSRVLRGLQRAAMVACDSEATRAELERHAPRAAGPHGRSCPLACTRRAAPTPDAESDREAVAAHSVGTRRALSCCTWAARSRESASTPCLTCSPPSPRRAADVRLLRVGGPFTAEQDARIDALGLQAAHRRAAVHRAARAGGALSARRAGAAALGARGLRLAGGRSAGLRHAHRRQRSAGLAGSGRVGGRILSRRRRRHVDGARPGAARRARAGPAALGRAARRPGSRGRRSSRGTAAPSRCGRSTAGSRQTVRARVTTPLTILHVGKFYPPAPGGMEKVVQLLCESERRSGARQPRAGRQHRRPAPCTSRCTACRSLAWPRFGAIGSVGICPAFPVGPRAGDPRRHGDPRAQSRRARLRLAHAAARAAGGVVPQRSAAPAVEVPPDRTARSFDACSARAARIVVSSPNLAEHAAELQPFRDKCVVIPFGIDRSTARR